MIDVAPLAAEIPLVLELVARIRRNLELADGRAAADFNRLRGAVAVVVVDSGSAFTLRFDLGRLGVHEGLIGVPDMTIRGSSDGILQLLDAPGLGGLRERPSREALGELLRKLGRHELKVYGWIWHWGLVRRLLRVFRNDTPASARNAGK